MNIDTQIPFLNAIIDPDTDDSSGCTVISLVTQPAIELDYQMFSKNAEAYPFKFAIQNKEMQMIGGPILLANTPIYRNDEKGEYYLTFSKEIVYQIQQKFHKTQRGANVSAEHSGLLLSGIYLTDNWVIDSALGKPSPTNYPNLKDGDWFGFFKVDNPDLWAEIKAGTWKGFSIEALLSYAKVQLAKRSSDFNVTEWNEIVTIINEL